MASVKLAKIFRWGFIALVFIAVFAFSVSFVVSNNETTQVHFVFFQLDNIAVELLVLASFILGGIAGLLSASFLLFLSYRKNKRLLRQYHQHMG